MKSVFIAVRGTLAVGALLVLFAAAPASSAGPRDRHHERFLDRIIVWLQGRISIPPG